MFRKNTAGQYIHFQGVDSSTGGIKSGVSWTMRVCLDGTFAAKQAGTTITEDGTTGWYKVALDQADTNGNDIGYNFTGTGAIPVTINVITTACDPTSTAFGLSLAKTTNITGLNDIAATAVVSGGAITTSGGAVSTVSTVNALANNAITAAVIATDAIDSDAIAATAVTEIQSGLATAAALATVDTVVDAIQVKTDQLTFTTANQVDATTITISTGAVSAAALATDAVNEIADGILDRNMATGTDSGSTTVRTPRQALRAIRNKVAIAAGTATIYKEDDATSSWTAAITTTAGDPISAVDPAGP